MKNVRPSLPQLNKLASLALTPALLSSVFAVSPTLAQVALAPRAAAGGAGTAAVRAVPAALSGVQTLPVLAAPAAPGTLSLAAVSAAPLGQASLAGQAPAAAANDGGVTSQDLADIKALLEEGPRLTAAMAAKGIDIYISYYPGNIAKGNLIVGFKTAADMQKAIADPAWPKTMANGRFKVVPFVLGDVPQIPAENQALTGAMKVSLETARIRTAAVSAQSNFDQADRRMPIPDTHNPVVEGINKLRALPGVQNVRVFRNGPATEIEVVFVDEASKDAAASSKSWPKSIAGIPVKAYVLSNPKIDGRKVEARLQEGGGSQALGDIKALLEEGPRLTADMAAKGINIYISYFPGTIAKGILLVGFETAADMQKAVSAPEWPKALGNGQFKVIPFVLGDAPKI